MRPTLLLFAALAACFDDAETTAPTPDPAAEAAKAKAKAKAKAPAKTFADKAADARALGLAGDPDGALTAAEALLAEKPEDDSMWVLVESLAIASSDPGAVLDRMDAPVGGQAVRHHLLRARLALAAERPDDALAAAQAALAEQADAAASLLAQATREGAVLPETEGDPTPAESLALWASAKDARAARPYAEAALAVAGWRAALLRGHVQAERGETEAALASYAAAAEADDPRAVAWANVLRTRLALAGKAPTADAVAWSSAGLEAVQEAGLADLQAESIGQTVRAHLRAVQAAEAVALVEPAFRAALAVEGSSTVGPIGVQLARVALAAGQPVLAAEAAGAARAALTEGGDAALLQDAAWQEVWATWSIGRPEDAKAAAAVVTGPRKAMADALALATAGQLVQAADRLDYADLSPREAAYGALAAARIETARAVDHLQAAVRSADAARDPVLALDARLQLEAAQRAARLSAADKTRAELARAAAEGAAGDGLRAELAARTLAAGGATDATAAPAAWQALARKATTTDQDAVTAPVAAWAGGRAASATGDAAAGVRYVEALGKLPLHRQGALRTGTALDGSQGVGLATDLDLLLTDDADTAALTAGLAVMEAAHRLDVARADARTGRTWHLELPTEHRDALMGAVARVRAEMLRYHAGAGPLPVAAFEALAEAEAAAGQAVPSLQRALPSAIPDVATLRRALDGSALLSFAAGPQSVYGLVLSPQGGSIRALGRTANLLPLARKHRASLVAAAGQSGKANHAAGDGLRAMLIDPFMGDLSGIGRYLVLAPSDIFTFPFSTFPEQADGLRWLAAIRTVGGAPDLRSIHIPPEKEPEEQVAYNPDFLGLGAPVRGDAKPAAGAEEPADGGGTSDEELLRRHRANSNMPLDLGAAARQFGDEFRSILVGGQATTAEFVKNTEKARYIHISEVGVGADGGLSLADGDLSLATIRTTPIRAQLVIVTAEAPPDVQLARARAFLDAGAQAVLVGAWDVPAKVYDRLFDGFYEAINRDRTPAAAAREARESLLRTSLNEFEQDDPADWGTMMLYSLP